MITGCMQDILIQLNMSGGPANRLSTIVDLFLLYYYRCVVLKYDARILMYTFILNHVSYMHSHSIIFLIIQTSRFLYFSNALYYRKPLLMSSQHICIKCWQLTSKLLLRFILLRLHIGYWIRLYELMVHLTKYTI